MTSKKMSKADKAEDRWTRLMFFFDDAMTLTHGSNLLRLQTCYPRVAPERLRSEYNYLLLLLMHATAASEAVVDTGTADG